MSRRPAYARLSLAAIIFAHCTCLALSSRLRADEPPPLTIHESTAVALERHPRLAKGAYALDAARGKALQSSLHPNPVVSVTGDELGDRTGASGIWTSPKIEQEIVGRTKRTLNVAAAEREVAKLHCNLAAERLALKAEVESRYIECVAAIRRVEFLERGVKAAEEAVDIFLRRKTANVASRLEVVLVQSQLEKLKAEAAGSRLEATNGVVRLAMMLGEESLQGRGLQFDLDAPIPTPSLESVLEAAAGNHPDVEAARIELQRAQTLLSRAQAEPYPNLTLSTGYTRQNQNRSHDWLLGVSAPLPAWNRNQGNIQAARAAVGEAAKDIARSEMEIRDKAAVAHRDLIVAAARAESYRNGVLPKMTEAYAISLKAVDTGTVDFDKLFEAQRGVADARMEHLKASTEAWLAAVKLSAIVPNLVAVP